MVMCYLKKLQKTFSQDNALSYMQQKRTTV